MSNLSDARLLNLPKIEDPRGNLSVIEQTKQVPFEVRRAYWIYDVPGGKDRGSHAYKENQEFIVALSGSFDVVLDDGENKRTFPLNRSYFGLYVPKGMWRTMTNFSTNSLALVLSSTEYDENDYITDYEEFKTWRKNPDYKTSSPNDKTTITVCEFMNGKRVGEKLSVYDCQLVELNKAHHPEGNLTYVYENVNIPFPLKRVFYNYDIPGGESRGAHAHKECHQFIVAASGAFEVVLDDGENKRIVMLNRPFFGLHVPPGIWAKEQNFSSGSICLVLASHEFDEADYIRDYNDFLNYRK